MDRIKTNREPVLTWALPIRILAISALLVALFSFCVSFLLDSISFITCIINKGDVFRDFFLRGTEFVYALLAVTPMVLLIVYLFGLYKHKNSGMLMTTILGIFAVKNLWNIVAVLIMAPRVSNLELLLFLVCIPAIISAFLEFRNKILVVISMSAVLLCLAGVGIAKWGDLILFLCDGYPLGQYLLSSATSLMEIGSACIFVIAILLFGLKNNTQLIATVPVEEETDPEQELLDLREQYDAGQISEEEYQAQRTEIISKL